MKLEFTNNNIDISPVMRLITDTNQFFEISEKHGVYLCSDEMLAKLVELAEHLNKFFKFAENEI